MDFKQKYIKYKEKYLNLKMLVGGDIWLERRHNSEHIKKIEVIPSENIIKLINDDNIFGKGGQSKVYNFIDEKKEIPENSLCVRVFKNLNTSAALIDLPEEVKNKIIIEDNKNNVELYYSKLFSNIVSKKINPHFVFTNRFIYRRRSDEFVQLLEKFEGDIENLSKEIYLEANIFEQMLFALVTLTNQQIIITDIKLDNIFYKKLEMPICIHYIMNKKNYYIKTNYLFVIGDYGKARPMFKNPDKTIQNFIVVHHIFKHLIENYTTLQNFTNSLNLDNNFSCNVEGAMKHSSIMRNNGNTLYKCLINIINSYQLLNPTKILLEKPADLYTYGPFDVLDVLKKIET